MARVVVTPAADADLQQIIAHLGGNAGFRIAARYVADFERLFDHVAAFPESGSPRPKLGASIRICLVHPYVFIYRRYEAEDVVRVLRVLHGARRITGRLLRGAK